MTVIATGFATDGSYKAPETGAAVKPGTDYSSAQSTEDQDFTDIMALFKKKE